MCIRSAPLLLVLLGSASTIGLVACTKAGSDDPGEVVSKADPGAHGEARAQAGGHGGHGGHGGDGEGGGAAAGDHGGGGAGHGGHGAHGDGGAGHGGHGAHGDGGAGHGGHGERGGGEGERGGGEGERGGGEGEGGGEWHGEAGAHGDEPGHDGSHRHDGGHHRFDDPVAWAAKFDSPDRIAWQKPDAVIAKLAPAKSAVVADLGAGTGTFAVRFAAAVPEGKVIANDVEATMVAYIEERAKKASLGNLIAVQGEAGDPKLPETVDLAFMCDVFHHVEDIPGFFTKVRDKLAEGGRLVIVDFKKDAPDDAPGPPKAMRVRSSDVVKQLTDLGFRVSEVDSTTLEFQYIVVMDRA